MNFLEELQWRGLIHQFTPRVEDYVTSNLPKAYIGFDPTADSLHIGSLVQIIMLSLFQKHGGMPIAVVGGSTGMIGDPSGKSKERNLLDVEQLQKNVEGIRKQLEKFLDFEGSRPAKLLNNYDWTKDITFLDFVRDYGKHITVNYMMSKDSVKNRIHGEGAEGMSFTEFTYQLLQGYDFLWLYENEDCKLQMGGSDQWGNITTGTELIRRKVGGHAYALTCPLITKSDGTKFGKSEGGENIWLDPKKTSPYKFYQFWLNVSDEDAERYLKIYSPKSPKELEDFLNEYQQNPTVRGIQKKLAEEITTWVHGKEECDKAIKASQILFGKSTKADLMQLETDTFLEIFEGVPQKILSKTTVFETDIIELMSEVSGFLSSKSEVRRAIKENSLSINQEKISEDFKVEEKDLIAGKYLLLQRGKKNYFILIVE